MVYVAVRFLRPSIATGIKKTICVHADRGFHASRTVLARQGRRTSRSVQKVVTHDEEDDKVTTNSKQSLFFTQGELEENPQLAADFVDENDDTQKDEDFEKLLEPIDELFGLDPKAFGRRLASVGNEVPSGVQRKVFQKNADGVFEEEVHSDSEDEMDDESDLPIDRAERLPKRRLLKVLEDFDAAKPLTGKNAESMALRKSKTAAPLEKKVKKTDPERVSHRQERVELSVSEFVQNLLLEDSDMTESTVYAQIVEASVSPDLRRIVLFWDPARKNSTDRTVIAKRKVEGVQIRLQKRERWIRMAVTRHLNLKYSPKVQFKRSRQTTEDVERRMIFEREMAWLNRFK